MDLVSIIIPNFNSELTIAETIKSVKSQTYSEWELLIVDDGSTDNCKEVIKPFISPQIHYIQRPNNVRKGGNACRNLGIMSAQGKYLIFLDSDDLLAPYCLQQRIDYMKQHDDLDFAVFNMYSFSDNIEVHKLHSHLNAKNPLKHFLGLNCLWQTTSPIWKTVFMKKIMFDEDFPRFQDPEMTIRAFLFPLVRYKIVKESTPDAYYRVACKKVLKRKAILDQIPAYSMFISKFLPIIDKYNFLESKYSLLYLMSMSYMFSGSRKSYRIYKTSVDKLNLKRKFAERIIVILCSPFLKEIVTSNKVFKKLYSLSVNELMRKKWKSDFVTYNK